ncbi:hypothetical protein G436_1684 [Leptospira interrogans serovar Hardjo str. Norma]|uniref:Uncharacterized protein n=1 Tax=Leptospira interrogans serovar Hardjo str. Norma TaxID=1279460 RepID=A0A0M4MTJ4_LEPIR|nr:hypothetical protein G436_1684 [Leptospira interrogans serovar Hardjo str. Norma]
MIDKHFFFCIKELFVKCFSQSQKRFQSALHFFQCFHKTLEMWELLK